MRSHTKVILKKGLLVLGLSVMILLSFLTFKVLAETPKNTPEQNVPQIEEEQQAEEYKENRDKIVKEFNALTKRFYAKVVGWRDELKRGRIDSEEYHKLVITDSKRLLDEHSKLLMEFDALIPPSLKLVKRHLLTIKGFKEGIEADRSVTIKDFEAEKRHRNKSIEYFMKCSDDLKREMLYDN